MQKKKGSYVGIDASRIVIRLLRSQYDVNKFVYTVYITNYVYPNIKQTLKYLFSIDPDDKQFEKLPPIEKNLYGEYIQREKLRKRILKSRTNSEVKSLKLNKREKPPTISFRLKNDRIAEYLLSDDVGFVKLGIDMIKPLILLKK